MAELIDNGRTDIAIGPRPTCTEAHVEVFVHYDPDNGMAVWVDQLAADHGIVPRAAHAQPADRRSTRRCRDGRNDRPRSRRWRRVRLGLSGDYAQWSSAT
jgi:hypothetical protein